MQCSIVVMHDIHWTELAHSLEIVQARPEPGQRVLIGGDQYARRALELILGERNIRAAVDAYIGFDDGAELARSVLWLLHPWSAMQRCHEIYQSGSEIEHRRRAIELLRVVADRRALLWIRQYLDDPDSVIRMWGVGIIDQLLFSSLIDPDECSELLTYARQHMDPLIREKMGEIDAERPLRG